MHSAAGDATEPFSGLGVGARLGPVTYAVSEAANERYWDGAGISHSARTAGVLFPPMAANLTILAFQAIAPAPLLHTDQVLTTRAIGHAPAEIVVRGEITGRFAKRGREYAEVTTQLHTDGTHLWTSVATFVEAVA